MTTGDTSINGDNTDGYQIIKIDEDQEKMRKILCSIKLLGNMPKTTEETLCLTQ